MPTRRHKKCESCGEKCQSTSTCCVRCSNSKRPRKSLGSLSPQEFHTKHDDFRIFKDFLVDEKNWKLYRSDTFERLPVKTSFMIPCESCGEKYKAGLQFESVKKHRWNCKSCAMSKEWEIDDYRDKHVKAIKETKATHESKVRHSQAQKVKWKNANTREKMLLAIQESHQTQSYREKMSNALKKRWSTFPLPPTKTKRSKIVNFDGNEIAVKSSYESDFANYMTNLGIRWEYESKSYRLSSYNQSNIVPDFFIPSLNLIVEVKGFLWHDAHEKWAAFCYDYPDIPKVMLFKEDLQKLFMNEVTLESYCEKTRR